MIVAIYFHSDYSVRYNSRNFGDDINPYLLGMLFDKSIIDSRQLCVVGVGTIINDRNADAISHYERKIVFSSGAGYGTLDREFDSSWDFVCVRGPYTCEALRLPRETAICDGAILLADFYPPLPASKRSGVLFIPHIRTSWSAPGLQKICRDLGLIYLVPDAPFEEFIEAVQTASLVVTESMHGAILADAMRTPWIPIEFLHHNRFKWTDWFASVDLPYAVPTLRPRFWDSKGSNLEMTLKTPFRLIKHSLVKASLRTIVNKSQSVLSGDSIIRSRKRALRDQVENINLRYSK